MTGNVLKTLKLGRRNAISKFKHLKIVMFLSSLDEFEIIHPMPLKLSCFIYCIKTDFSLKLSLLYRFNAKDEHLYTQTNSKRNFKTTTFACKLICHPTLITTTTKISTIILSTDFGSNSLCSSPPKPLFTKLKFLVFKENRASQTIAT